MFKPTPILLVLALVTTTGCLQPGGSDVQNLLPEMLSFDSCSALEGYVKAEAISRSRVLQSLHDDGTPADFDPLAFLNTDDEQAPEIPNETEHGREDGVDVPDIFKVDDTHAFAIHGGNLVIVEAIKDDPAPGADPIITPGGQTLTKIITDAVVVIQLPIPGTAFEMFLDGNRLVVFTRTQYGDLQVDGPARDADHNMVTALVYDITDRRAPILVRELAFEGSHLASRRVANTIYVVTNAELGGPSTARNNFNGFEAPLTREAAILRSPLDAWLPYTYETRQDQPTEARQADCSSSFRSTTSGGDAALSVASFDIFNDETPVHTTTILGEGAVVYASPQSIVVALTNYAELTYPEAEGDAFGIDNPFSDTFDDLNPLPAPPPTEPTPSVETTWLHRFRLTESGQAEFHATGAVEGWILNGFSLSEHNGVLRVATQKTRGGLETMVFTLGARDATLGDALLNNAPIQNKERFDIIGSLRNIALGETLFATRFKKEIGYLVTFRRTDPLWTIDLSNPIQPRIRGELIVPGYSTYLHPIDGGKLLALGRADLTGAGLKLSLFDVSNLDRPTAVEEIEEGTVDTTSEATHEHRAFSWFGELSTLAIPIDDPDHKRLAFYHVDPDRGFSYRGDIDHSDIALNPSSTSASVRRARRIGAYLYAFSGAGITISRSDSFERVVAIDLEDR